MIENRVEVVQRRLEAYLQSAVAPSRRLHPDAPLRPGTSLTASAARDLFHDQVRSRWLDVMARQLKAEGAGFYTIASAGHEQNAILGAQLRITDPCFLHYRSGAFMMSRARKEPGIDPVHDTILSLCAAADDPASGGRHKVWGSRRLWVPPQTSTIASHLPKAMGMAFALGRRKRLGSGLDLPQDAIVMCSFGDASTGHATALSGINAARYGFRRGNPMPILFVCEDNRVGISVEKPRRWIADSFAGLSQLDYMLADGEMDDIWDTVEKAIRTCRQLRRPVFLRIPTVRLWGHAGSDVETTYRTLEAIEAIEAQDPLLQNARRLVDLGAASPAELLSIFENTRLRVEEAVRDARRRPRLISAEEILAPLAPYDSGRCRRAAERFPDPEQRRSVFGEGLPEHTTTPSKRTLAAHINAALTDAMIVHREILVFGEDVAKKGGVYYVTMGLQKRFGTARVFDTLLDETTILGLAQGCAHAGLLPIPEIQYLAYLHNAIDQLRGEACSLSFFSNGQFTNPMLVRIASFAYQKGFGGHFHNDNSIGALREIPGLVIAAPSRGDDAARMLRGCLGLAIECGRVVCFLEPIALYHEKDLYEEGDRRWLTDYPPPGSALLPGETGVYHEEARDVLIVSYGNGLRLSLRAARRLRSEHGISPRVLDLRWLSPLPLQAVSEHADACEGVVIVDECRATAGGVADALLARLAETGYRGSLRSVRSLDTYVPLGPAADLVLVSENQIVESVLSLVQGS